jgi:uncharacterized protein YjbI with pentapeptide repeats
LNQFTNSDLKEVSLQNLDLENSTFNICTFDNCDLRGIKTTPSTFRKCQFIACKTDQNTGFFASFSECKEQNTVPNLLPDKPYTEFNHPYIKNFYPPHHLLSDPFINRRKVSEGTIDNICAELNDRETRLSIDDLNQKHHLDIKMELDIIDYESLLNLSFLNGHFLTNFPLYDLEIIGWKAKNLYLPGLTYKIRMHQCFFIDSNLENCCFQQIELSQVIMKNCRLNHADMRASRLNIVDFFYSDLTNVDFSGSHFKVVKFSGCILTGACFKNVTYETVICNGKTLNQFCNLEKELLKYSQIAEDELPFQNLAPLVKDYE